MKTPDLRVERRRLLAAAAASAIFGPWTKPAWSGRRVWSPPATHGLRIIENVFIPMPDGTRLAARLFLPEDALKRPAGAILEYLPYRQRDMTRGRDEHAAAWLVPRGFAYIRVDIRGSGDSDGVINNEYSPQEQRDAVPVIEWIARQPWCNGRVGMRGASYGAFSALQAAKNGAPGLVAIAPAVGTENGYTDDVHTLGGCLINENMFWGTIWKGIMIPPPDPEIVGGNWRQMWMQRLEGQIPLVSEWLSHQLIDDYWRAQIFTDYAAVKCAVYTNGGMNDAYVNTVPRLLEKLSCPRKGLVGPWGHCFPGEGDPGPAIDWAVEETRWWDYWLNQHDNGIMDEPMLRTYMAETSVAQYYPKDIPGRWVSEAHWPSPAIHPMNLHIGPGRALTDRAPATSLIRVTPSITVGGCIPFSDPQDMRAEAATEQSADDALSLIFETEPLPSDIEIAGNPVLHLRFRADKKVAKLAARLNEITPDGKSWMVSYGAINLSHAGDHTAGRALEEGKEYQSDLQFYYVSRVLHRGSRIRISVSQSQWPIVWPSPELVNIDLVAGQTVLELPVRPRPAHDDSVPFAILRDTTLTNKNAGWTSTATMPVTITGQGASRTVHYRADEALKAEKLEAIGLTTNFTSHADGEMNEGDPNSYRLNVSQEIGMQRKDWHVRVTADATLRSTPTEFIVDEGIAAWLGNEKIYEKRWNNHVRRNYN